MDFPKLSRSQRSALESAAATYEAVLPGSPAISHLEARGIPEGVARTARLGYVAEPEAGHEDMAGRLAIPYVTPKGVVSIRFRAVGEEGEVKYLDLPGGSNHLYNVQDLHSAFDVIAIAEGELDALVLSSLCGIPAVGISGASKWRRFWNRLFVDFERVLLVMDDDKAGRDAARKLKGEVPNSVIAHPEGGDVNEVYMERGAAGIREHLRV